jgi:tRNA(Arg) A34 adenosine deaminase TadA
MILAQLHLTLPAWVHEFIQPNALYTDAESQVGLAIGLSEKNVEHRSGGPFGAAVFTESGRLIGIGVNRVMPQSCSIAHAEIMALSLSQQRLQQFRLNQSGEKIILATSSQPCCQCFGASVWAGIDALLIGARASDVESLAGFDEGPLPENWVGELEKRGIRVQQDILRERACAVLKAYRESGVVY